MTNAALYARLSRDRTGEETATVRQLEDCRAFAAARSRPWPRWRRAVYALAAPLIPMVRLWRLAPVAGRTRGRPQLLKLAPALATGLIVHAAGEAVGFALGAGSSWTVVTKIELYRERSVREGERP